MIEKLNQKLNQFYHFSFVFLMVVTLGTIFYFWKLGFVDGSRNKELHKANYILEQYEAKKPLKEIKSIVFSENSKLAITKINALTSDFTKVNKLVEDKSFKKVIKETEQVKTAIANLISFPKVDKIVSVFNDKMEKYNDFVKYNKWRTLTRTSNRILERSKGHINKNKLSQFVQSINKDLDYMEKVTEKSYLDRSDKSEVLSRINNLRTETKMLKKYIGERSFFEQLMQGVDTQIEKWLTKIAPDLSYQKIQVEQMGRYYIMGLLGILALTSMIFFAGLALSRWNRRKSQESVEKFVEDFVTEGLIAGKHQELEGFSQRFQNFTDQTANYIEKRMSYGAIFQEALPLSSLMLDKNLKVIWANKHFCDDWLIAEEEINKDYLSWDYLSKLTNIGDNDPVLEALKNRVAGIYQIQIKADEHSDVRPYEMFVSPVKFNHETRIMLFFYPLMSVQDTITSQARSIINPIEKTLTLMQQGDLDQEQMDELKKEFEIADIVPLYNLFVQSRNKTNQDKEQLVDQIEMLYHKIDQIFDVTDDIEKTNFSIGENNSSQIKNLKAFKTHVISLSTMAKELEHLGRKEFSMLQKSIQAFDVNADKVDNLIDIVEQLSLSIPKFGQIREEIKSQKSQMSEAKMRLSHSLAQMIHIKKQVQDAEVLKRFNNSYERVNSEFNKLDSVSVDLEKRLTALEVMLSKTQLLMNDITQKMPSFSNKNERKVLDEGHELVSQIAHEVSSFDGKLEETEDQLIVHLKALYNNTKNNIESSRFIAGSLEQRPSLIESTDHGAVQDEGPDEIRPAESL